MFDTERGHEDPGTLSSEGLEERIVDLAARIASATCDWLELVAEFDRREAYLEWGFDCCARWLAWRCSIAPRSAREQVRVARGLEDLPLIRKAMSRGELTYSKVRVLTRIATADMESDLLELARQATAAQLERLARAYGRAVNADDAERIHERRYLAYDWEDDGSLSVRGSLSAEDGALLLRALEVGREAIREIGKSEGGPAEPLAEGGSVEPRPSRGPFNADALVLMAESLLASGAASRTAGERAQVVVHVDSAALAGQEEGPRRCELEDGAPIAPETARRLSCDASRVDLVEGSQGPLSVGRRSRTVPSAMRRALGSRDGGCRFPGCTHRRWTDAHHIQHWAQGGETSAENLVQLCRRHHRLVHEGGFRVDRGPDHELRFWRPDGSLLSRSPLLRSVGKRPTRDHGGRRQIGSIPAAKGNPIPLSAGERMDLDLTVVLLAEKATRSPRGP